MSLQQQYRFPEHTILLEEPENLSEKPGYFRLGTGTVCYGRTIPSLRLGSGPKSGDDALPLVSYEKGRCRLPFRLGELMENLRLENYCNHNIGSREGILESRIFHEAYYMLRPLMVGPLRRLFQRMALRNWDKIPFPRWPVDSSVEDILEQILKVVLAGTGVGSIPFIWFWPEGKKGCILLTHDIETQKGLDFCDALMDLDEASGFRSSFQVVPEERYEVSPGFLHQIRQRGFEVNVHDLNHDGHLFKNKDLFMSRAVKINHHVREFKALGFRSGALYRNIDWITALEVEYDMSMPNVAHLEPQRGGCCTVMPYFVGPILELPVTLAQDYGLFSTLGDYSIDIWRKQSENVASRFGLIHPIVHPDYVIESRARAVYRELLAYLADLRDSRDLWAALPAAANRWWRQRSKMNLKSESGRWVIEGPGSELARVAHARLVNGRLEYQVEP